MQAFQTSFIKLALEQGILSFGEFKLKSGRISPYFFNLGKFNTGTALAQIGYFYASALMHAGESFDVLFGPAYKGIPLVCATAISLAQEFQQSAPYAFNRKEAKDHGEGGNIVGSPLKGKIMIVDDVMTAGTAVHQAIELIISHGAQPAGVVLALDRQECGQNQQSATREIADQYNIPVISIISLDDVIHFLHEHQREYADYARYLPAIEKYRRNYEIKSD